jgi:uncharacterized membrane protein YfcA
LFVSLPYEWTTIAFSALVVCGAYVVFGISAFGAALITVPVLSHFYPLDFVLPTCVLLDVSAAIAMGARVSRAADRRELHWMVPLCLLGAVLGVTLLVSLPRRATLAAFGVLLLFYGVYTLYQGKVVRMISRGWAPLAGFMGGLMGTLFGIGAPPYAMYLSHRITDKAVLRATLSSMVLMSTTIRALVFAFGGLMLRDRLVMFAVLLPFALAGLWWGNRLQGRISREQLGRFISLLVLLIGASVLIRAFT